MNTKILLSIGIVIAALVAGFFVLNSYIYNEKQADFVPRETAELTGTILAVDLEQATYDGPVVLTLQSSGGDVVNVAVPSMGLPLCAAYQANNIGDVYLLKTGDEIEVRGTVSENGDIVPCESPDHYLRPTPLVVDDFEGEADPKKMSITMKPWTWVKTTLNDGSETVPKDADAFVITFATDGTFTATTDCNSMSGSYSSEGGSFSVSNISSTLMFCAESQETEFARFLTDSTTHLFTSKGELVLELPYDSGSVIFR